MPTNKFGGRLVIKGGTDLTDIGNVGDRLKVDSLATSTPGQFLLDSNYIYSAAFVVNATASNSDNPVFLLKNPSGSGKVLYFLSLTGNSTISNERTLFKVFQNSTISANGTTASSFNRNVGNGASASVMQAYTLPTVSSLGTGNLATIQSGENTNSQNIVSIENLAIQPGNHIVLTAKPKSNNREQAITAVWAEVPI